MLDDAGRLFDGTEPGADGLPIAAGLERMREKLAEPGTAVRLVGLSGMGKTQLVQALFDARIGSTALDPSLAVYAGAGAALDPSPMALLARLVRDRRRAVLIIDNGPLSLITVEYDVGDDDHEGTAVLRLEPVSDGIIEDLIARARPHAAAPDRRRIADLAEGNARLALAVAGTVKRRRSLAGLSRGDLFNRLFHQRRGESEALLRAAEACSLVYSFDIGTVDDRGAELPLLAELAGQTAADLHRHVAELLRRRLAQKRDRWRAVLPRALAIHLARAALENIPTATIRATMEERAPVRLRKSFTRRLRYLHDGEAAQGIIPAWLAPGVCCTTWRRRTLTVGRCLGTWPRCARSSHSPPFRPLPTVRATPPSSPPPHTDVVNC